MILKKSKPCGLALLGLGLALCGQRMQAAELLVNGGFETGDFTGWTTSAGGAGNWSVSSTTTSPLSGFPTAGPKSGNFYAIADETGPVQMTLAQNFTVAAGSQVNLSFAMYDNDFSGVAPEGTGMDFLGGPNQHIEVDIFAAGADPLTATPLDQLNYGPDAGTGFGPNPYENFSFDLTSLVGGGGTFEVSFGNVNNQSFNWQGVDDVSVQSTTTSSVPDSTSTFGCLGIATTALCAMRRRLQK